MFKHKEVRKERGKEDGEMGSLFGFCFLKKKQQHSVHIGFRFVWLKSSLENSIQQVYESKQ